MKRRIFLYLVLALVVIITIIFFARRPIMRQLGINFPGGEASEVDLTLPPGFKVNVFMRNLENPRFMAYKDGILFVAEGGRGRIIALPDEDKNGEADQIIVVKNDLDVPTSLAFHPETGEMYVGETGQVRSFTLNEQYQAVAEKIIIPEITTDGFHRTRTVLFGADGRLYLSAGSTCNVCEEEDPHRAAISVYNADGSEGRVFAKGLRNAVGMAVNPATGSLFATVNGRDLMGDDLPPETIYVVEDGVDYGWPRCHAARIEDPEFGYSGACDGVGKPVVQFQAHSAPLGLIFYDGQQFPSEYHGGMFVAYHGSWNRTVPTGYKLVFIPMDGDTPMDGDATSTPQDFATGWLHPDETVSGRPVGVTVAPDGSLMVSDDKAGMVYRIWYE